jgi:hypothetical protein
MTNINILEEWLHGFSSLLYLLFPHCFGDLSRVSGQASNETMRKTLFIIAIIKRFDNDSLLAGMSSSKNNNNFSSL